MELPVGNRGDNMGAGGGFRICSKASPEIVLLS